MKLSAILLAGALVLAVAVPSFARDEHQDGPPQSHNDCKEYCWMEYLTPAYANVNMAFVDSEVETSAMTGGNKVYVNTEIEDLGHGSNATLNNGVVSVTSGKASATTDSIIMANMIEPVSCHDCSLKDGFYINANVAFIESEVENMAKSGHNSAELSSEIEDLCHSNATINGGAATVVSGDAWTDTGSMIQVNLIGDWSKSTE